MGMESGQNMMYHGSSIKTWLCLELKSEHTSKLKVSSWRKSLLDAQLKRSKLSLVRCFDVADLLIVGLPLLLCDWRMVLLQPIATFLRGVPSNEYPIACNMSWKMTRATDKLRKKVLNCIDNTSIERQKQLWGPLAEYLVQNCLVSEATLLVLLLPALTALCLRSPTFRFGWFSAQARWPR